MPLGKSLNNIIGDYFGEEGLNLEESKAAQHLQLIKLSNIYTNPFQTRQYFEASKIKSLAEDIKQNGLLHPIVVLGLQSGGYQLLVGERRLRAVKSLGRDEITAIVKPETEISTKQQAFLTATENIQRQNLSPLELANTYQMLIETQSLTSEALADIFSVSGQHIKNYLRLLTLEPKLKQALLTNKIGEGHARHLVGLSPEVQNNILDEIIKNELTVKEIKQRVEALKLMQNKYTEERARPKVRSSHNLPQPLVQKAIKFAELLPSSKLKLTGDGEKGKIVISWG